MRRACHREQNAIRDVLRLRRVQAFVDLTGRLLVTAEADTRKVRVDKAGIDGGDVDRATEEVFAQRVGEAANRELRGHVDRSLLVRLPTRD